MRNFLLFCLFCVSGYGDDFLKLTKKHCIECHNPKKEKGDVDLTLFKSPKDFYRYYDLLKDFYSQVESGEMPPEEDSTMTDAERKTLVDYLGSVINKLENNDSKITGITRIRRLTSYEYDNSVKNATGLDLKLSENFPTSGGGSEGFQNDSTIMSVSPLLFENYITAAETISTHSHFDLKRGFTFSQRPTQPETKAETIKKITEKSNRLLASLYPKNFSVKRFLPKAMEAANEFNLSGRRSSSIKALAKKYKLSEHILKRAIIYFASTTGKTIMERDALRSWHLLRNEKYDPEKAKEYSKTFIEAWKNCLEKIPTLEGIKKRNYQVFEKNINDIFSFTDKEIAASVDEKSYGEYQQLKMALDFYENGMQSKFKSDIARQLIPHVRNLMFKAFRKPSSEKEVLLMTKDLMNTTRQFGINVAARIFVVRTFASMKFTYRHEDKAGKPTKITDYELANRLSYFLWASPPDEELLKLAGEKKLSDPKTLEEQVKRMLKNRQSSGLAKYFAAHWLKFNDILGHEGVSVEKFPMFTKELARDMWLESAICFEYIVKSDRSVLEIIDADYTFVNGRLRDLYGLEDGIMKFTKVKLNDKNRGGITGQASVLTLTSAALRTSPIHRGNWVNKALLGTPTPPAPANVEPLPDDEVVNENLTLKKQLEAHRNNPQCKSCHQKIDPLGFPLENFDPIGRWRNKYEKAPIDAHGETIDGKSIDGPQGLKKYLLKNKDNFLKHMSRKLLAYALGRSIEYYDFYVINQMVASLKKDDYRFSSMVFQIVNSYQFQHKN
ncbi:MAG: DUF1592 domain-containing protein [Lentisphaeraceae bacterium]|nr:DUF1592 domain-containing protein [Lentisphaeraceae bacterium]